MNISRIFKHNSFIRTKSGKTFGIRLISWQVDSSSIKRFDDNKIKEKLYNLPSQLESRRSNFSKRFSDAMEQLQTSLFFAGKRLNEITGYSDIESLKKDIEAQELALKSARNEVEKAKEAYRKAVATRSSSQREVNELLQRRDLWKKPDAERFTALYMNNHENEQTESQAQIALAEKERAADEIRAELGRTILVRYHEEQIWSDKIRRASTWGTWGLMGINILLFIIVQLGLEPWKRRRLINSFEEKVRIAMAQEKTKEMDNQVSEKDILPEFLESQSTETSKNAPPNLYTALTNIKYIRNLTDDEEVVAKRKELTVFGIACISGGAVLGLLIPFLFSSF